MLILCQGYSTPSMKSCVSFTSMRWGTVELLPCAACKTIYIRKTIYFAYAKLYFLYKVYTFAYAKTYTCAKLYVLHNL